MIDKVLEWIWAWRYNDPWGNELLWFEWDGHDPSPLDTEYVRADLLDAANARIADLEAEVSAWRQVQDAVAELEGHGPDWPSHGNAPLAVTAGYALHRQRAATARAEALEEAAAKADDWTLTAEEVANGTGWPANVGENIGDAIRALKGGSNG